jgi:hypothetical protein
MRVIVAKCEELMRPGVLPGVRQVKDGNADEDQYLPMNVRFFVKTKVQTSAEIC